MTNYGTERYILIPSNHKFFDKSIYFAKNKILRFFQESLFKYRKNRKKEGDEKLTWSGDNTYSVLLNCKFNNYKVLIYPSKINILKVNSLKNAIQFLIKIGLIEDVLENVDIDNIEAIIIKYKINITNSVFITEDIDFAYHIQNKYSNNHYGHSLVKKVGFSIKVWDENCFSISDYISLNETSDSLKHLLHNQFRSYRKMFSVKSANFVHNQVIYIGNDNDVVITKYINDNYNILKQKFLEKDLSFIYFPKLKNNPDELTKNIKSAIDYIYPQFKGQNLDIVLDFFKSISSQQYYDFILNSLQLPNFPKPSLIKNLFKICDGNENLFYYLPLNEKTIEAVLTEYAEKTVNPNLDVQEQYSKKSSLRQDLQDSEYNADDNFETEALKISDEIKSKIDVLLANGKHKALADMVIHICSNLKDIKPELYEKIKSLNIDDNRTKLSSLVIDSNYRIYLPDYGNIEIVMSPLPKTLYLFFLKNPKGIMLHDLVDYKKELLSIYNKITNSSEPTEIVKRIDDMVDMSNNSINEKCSRIKEAFVSKIDDSLAQHYYVNGKRGAPKKISIPPNLIVFK